MTTADYIQRYYSGLKPKDLVQHIRFCGRALAKDSSAEIVLNNGKGRIPIWKRKYKTKPNCLELQISAGHIGRHVVEAAAIHFEDKGIQFKTKLTPKRKVLSRVITSHEIDNVFTPKIVTDIIVMVSGLCGNEPSDFSIEYYCKFEDGCTVEESDPVNFSKTYRVGYSIGRIAGAVIRPFKHKG